MFPFEEDFVVAPQYKRGEQAKSVDFTTIFIISHDEHPVLFVEVKPSGHFQHISTRASADIQIRERFKVLFESVSVPKLYGISAMGTRICLYTMDKKNGELLPESIPDSSTRVTDTAPAERWGYDIMKPKGEDVLHGIIDEVKKMCREM